MKKIIGITGIRSDYDLMSGVYRQLTVEPNIDFSLIVTGAHLGTKFGGSYQQIIDDGIPVSCEIPALIDDDRAVGRAKSLAIQLQSLIDFIHLESPDILLALGDREEALNMAIVGSYLDIVVAHVAGGDRVIGNVDDQVRHAISCLSHLHFVTNNESAERLKKMGEQEFRIHNFGNPGLDRLIDCEHIELKSVFNKLGLEFDANEKFVLLLFHPLSSQWQSSGAQFRNIVNALKECGLNTLIIGPNSDPGSDQIREEAAKVARKSGFAYIENIPRELFVNLLRSAYFLIGNSSLGLLEAPTLGLPVINVGDRQGGRLHSENVVFIQSEKSHIIKTIEELLYDERAYSKLKNCSTPYGSGNSSKKIVKFLKNFEITKAYRIKEVTY